MSRPWMPLYVADYLADTRRLTMAEHGAYMLLIMEYWRNGGLPDDERKLARIVGATPEEWAAVRDNVAELFQPGWRHKRIDAELAKSEGKSEAARASAERRWQSNGNAKAMRTHSEGNANAHANAMLSQPQSNISPSLRSGDTRARRALAVEAKDAAKAFERFWEIWPNKTGKPVAIKSFFKVWREADAICAGVERYIAEKPPDRPWLNPATFLNQRRWEDAPAPVANARAGPPGDRGGFASMLMDSYEAGNGRESTGDIENLPPLSIAHGPAVERETWHDGGIFGRLPRPDG